MEPYVNVIQNRKMQSCCIFFRNTFESDPSPHSRATLYHALSWPNLIFTMSHQVTAASVSPVFQMSKAQMYLLKQAIVYSFLSWRFRCKQQACARVRLSPSSTIGLSPPQSIPQENNPLDTKLKPIRKDLLLGNNFAFADLAWSVVGKRCIFNKEKTWYYQYSAINSHSEHPMWFKQRVGQKLSILT